MRTFEQLTDEIERLTMERDRVARPHRYPETWCSQCGVALGSGNSGVSHCEDHEDVPRIACEGCGGLLHAGRTAGGTLEVQLCPTCVAGVENMVLERMADPRRSSDEG